MTASQSSTFKFGSAARKQEALWENTMIWIENCGCWKAGTLYNFNLSGPKMYKEIASDRNMIALQISWGKCVSCRSRHPKAEKMTQTWNCDKWLGRREYQEILSESQKNVGKRESQLSQKGTWLFTPSEEGKGWHKSRFYEKYFDSYPKKNASMGPKIEEANLSALLKCNRDKY